MKIQTKAKNNLVETKLNSHFIYTYVYKVTQQSRLLVDTNSVNVGGTPIELEKLAVAVHIAKVSEVIMDDS